MKILCCPTAFKGGLTGAEAARAMANGVEAALGPGSAIAMPLSDGGNGLIDALAATEEAAGAQLDTVEVSGPVGEPAVARLLTNRWGTVLESADACGLHLLPSHRRAPGRATTRGVGEAIVAASSKGARELVVGLGGSATVDGGTGMARALGYRFVDSDERELPEGGEWLRDLSRIEPAPPPPGRFTALADVASSLCGANGAARRFAGQKGAGPADIERLEEGLAILGRTIERDLGKAVADLPGAGAAGGLGAGCAAFLGAELRLGAPWVLDEVGFDRSLAASALVVTGEGRFDSTSALGKVVGEVIERARRARVPVLLVCGQVSGPVPPGVTVADTGGEWLDSEALTRRVTLVMRRRTPWLPGIDAPP